jgi:hypothetical protein
MPAPTETYGKPCEVHGPNALRYVKSNRCLECAKEDSAKKQRRLRFFRMGCPVVWPEEEAKKEAKKEVVVVANREGNGMITHELLRELLHYDPLTGVFTWLVGSRPKVRGRPRPAGGVAGYLNTADGYWVIPNLEGRSYARSRLAWFYMKGKWPTYRMAHKNLDRGDDRWDNLQVGGRRSPRRGAGT